MKLWHIAALLVVGIAVGAAFPGRLTVLFGQATLYVFLPALIFEAAWNLDFHAMRRKALPIALLAVPGVALTAFVIAVCAHYAGGFAWQPALVLGAILSATDPVAVVAVFRRLPVPRELATIVESESLLNDATAVVLYRAILAAVLLSAGGAGVWNASWQAVLGVAISILVGGALAYFAAFALRRQIGGAAQILATFAGAYGSYVLCDHFRWSGIFAVITFGIALRELRRHRVTVGSAQAVAAFWDAAAMLANFVLFFLIGAALDFTQLGHALPAAGITLVAVLLARAVLSYGLLALARAHLEPLWQTVVRMAGIRGALSLALAIATPAAIAQRTLIVNATFAVVVVTILAGTLTLTPRLQRLGFRRER
ncbi:MAG TPA: sodium:proton antiporter [Candidatus Baltobacteraceae bacterium]